MMTPSEVSAKLNIQPSTLRKYSALLEQEGIQFKRTHKNARLMEAQQKQLLAPVSEEYDLDAPESSSQEQETEPEPVTPKKDTRSLWARIWNK